MFGLVCDKEQVLNVCCWLLTWVSLQVLKAWLIDGIHARITKTQRQEIGSSGLKHSIMHSAMAVPEMSNTGQCNEAIIMDSNGR